MIWFKCNKASLFCLRDKNFRIIFSIDIACRQFPAKALFKNIYFLAFFCRKAAATQWNQAVIALRQRHKPQKFKNKNPGRSLASRRVYF